MKHRTSGDTEKRNKEIFLSQKHDTKVMSESKTPTKRRQTFGIRIIYIVEWGQSYR